MTVTVRSGWSRLVLLVGPWAIKVPSWANGWPAFLQGWLSNVAEARAGRLGLEGLCPVLLAGPGAAFVVMRRARPLTDSQWDSEAVREAVARAPVPLERKRCGFGDLGGRVVAVDYGEPYLPVALCRRVERRWRVRGLTRKRSWRRAACGGLVALAALTAACATTPPPAGLPDPADLPQCPASIRQEPLPQPRLPDGATIPRPVDEADAAGLERTLDHMAALAAWGRAGWARAEAARAWCAGLGRSPPS